MVSHAATSPSKASADHGEPSNGGGGASKEGSDHVQVSTGDEIARKLLQLLEGKATAEKYRQLVRSHYDSLATRREREAFLHRLADWLAAMDDCLTSDPEARKRYIELIKTLIVRSALDPNAGPNPSRPLSDLRDDQTNAKERRTAV